MTPSTVWETKTETETETETDTVKVTQYVYEDAGSKGHGPREAVTMLAFCMCLVFIALYGF